MVERIDKEEGGLRSKEEIARAVEELHAASVLQKEGLKTTLRKIYSML